MSSGQYSIGRALSARDRDTVMAVDDKVDVPDAIELDGRKPARPEGEILEIFPPLPQLFLARQEGPVEFALPLHRAHDPLERNVLDPPVDHLAKVQPLAHLIEGEQVGRTLQEMRQEVANERAPPGAVESVHRASRTAARSGR